MSKEFDNLQEQINVLIEAQRELEERLKKLFKLLQDYEKLNELRLTPLEASVKKAETFVDFYGTELRRLQGLQSASFLASLKKRFPDIS